MKEEIQVAMPKRTHPTVKAAKASATKRQNGQRGKGKRDARKSPISAEGIGPVDYLLLEMRNMDNDLTTRIECAKAAAPYLHPRLQAVHQTGGVDEKSYEDWVKEMESIVDDEEAA